MIEEASGRPVSSNRTSQAWLHALELTAPISRNRTRIMPTIIQEVATRWGTKPALLSDRECLSHAGLAARQNQYARWGIAQGIKKGDVVCLLMGNRPEYVAIWLGLCSIGAVVALVNTNLSGRLLAGSLNLVEPKHIIVASEFIEKSNAVRPALTGRPVTWAHGAEDPSFRRIDCEIEQMSSEPVSSEAQRDLTIEDQALYIYTSGTTGMPKAAKVSHARVLQWALWFCGMLEASPDDRMYNCLPMYHSVGGVLATGALLAAGGSVVIREKFSCAHFWEDVRRWECTMFQYIGELCRYLLHSTRKEDAAGHRIRMACGNGMAFDVWGDFKNKFKVPRILEFYASTEGGVSLFNAEEKQGAIGRIPPYLSHRMAPELVKVDYDTCEPIRDEEGHCVRCGIDEPGEALGRVVNDATRIGVRFDGYSDVQASEKKILRNVFKPGDAWLRTGDLMRKDGHGFYYFVDRVGDTFRWKGENVATTEVSDVIRAFPGVKHASVYGVSIPAADGAAGMAALVTDDEVNLEQFREYINEQLPPYSRPLFVRIKREMDVTVTFKYSNGKLKQEGYDPKVVRDPLFFDSREDHAFVPLDAEMFEKIRGGQLRL